MKKGLLVTLALMTLFVLVACGSKEIDGENNNEDVQNLTDNSVVSLQDKKDPLKDLYWKTSLTVDDLDRIDEFKFPKSYTYSKYDWNNWNSMVETWDHVYPRGVNILLPIHESMVKREVISSMMDNDRISTTVDITLSNGESYPVKYVNDSDTLEYVWASLNTPTSTILYTFEY